MYRIESGCTQALCNKAYEYRSFIGVAIIVATFAAALFAVLALFKMATLVTALLAGGSLLSALMLTALYCLQRPRLREDNPQSDSDYKESPHLDLSRRKTLVDTSPKLLAEEEWGVNLSTQSFPQKPTEFNLLNPEERVIKENQSKMAQLPMVGRYSQDYTIGALTRVPELAVRLPPSQIVAFPKKIQEAFANKSNVELYFLIYRDEMKDRTRNLVMHSMVLPNYNPAKHQNMRKSMQVGLFKPKGISTQNKRDNCALNSFKKQSVHCHGDKGGNFAISPDNCRFTIEENIDAYSFYGAATFEGKAVAFYSIFVRDPYSTEGQAILQSVYGKTVGNILSNFKTNGSRFLSKINKLFRYYP